MSRGPRRPARPRPGRDLRAPPARRHPRLHAAWTLMALLCLGCLAGGPVSAEPVAAVVEFYTSQGCATCPGADRLAGELARRPGILALTLPVTYWDYLGWADNLALPGLTERQRAYARAHGERQLYTPQAIVNGGHGTLGANRSGLEHALAEAAGVALAVPVRSEERDGRIVVEVGGAPDALAADGPLGEVLLLPVLRRRTVPIERGENVGRVLSYVNVVRDVLRLGTWTGRPARFEVPPGAARVREADAYVVLLQAGAGGRPGRILGAFKGPGL